MFGPPIYTLAPEELIADQESRKDMGDLEMVLSLKGKGPFDGVVIGVTQPKISADRKIQIGFDIIALPASLMKHREDIVAGRGKTFRLLSREINKTVSYTFASVITEIENELKITHPSLPTK